MTEASCPACGGPLTYNEFWDREACFTCNTWTEGDCGYPGCYGCEVRPATPLPPGLVTS